MTMTEAQSGEVEKVLLYISDARTRAGTAAEGLAREGADEHIVEAMRQTERSLGEMHTRLTQQTFYAIDPSLKLAV
jgi:hypothetical protein